MKVKVNGKWGYVCSEGWSYEDARVICGQLGFPDAKRHRSVPSRVSTKGRTRTGRTKRDVPYFLTELGCTGYESALVSCPHFGLKPKGHTCNGGPVAVTCTRRNRKNIVSELLVDFLVALQTLYFKSSF